MPLPHTVDSGQVDGPFLAVAGSLLYATRGRTDREASSDSFPGFHFIVYKMGH